MKSSRRSFLVFAVLALVLLAMATPAAAQVNPRVTVFFRNTTPHFVWVTLYERLCKVHCYDEIIRDGSRQQVGPLQVAPGRNYVFNIPRYGKIKLRTQAQDACGQNIPGGDTSMERGGIGYETRSVEYTLHKAENRQSYWLTSP